MAFTDLPASKSTLSNGTCCSALRGKVPARNCRSSCRVFPARAVLTPANKDQAALGALERSERERLERGDAFAELQALAKRKQSVNKPQVCKTRMFRSTCGLVIHPRES